MQLHAFAKINLDLRILGKRPDGYHELRTIFQAVDWSDDINLNASDRFEFSASAGPQDESNLAVRAVRAFETASGIKADVSIQLHKNIPSGAGLGGGSADAAVVFLGLQRLYGWAPAEGSPLLVLRALGSDIPFFGVGGRALGSGRGDELTELTDDTDYWLVLVHPGFPISTPEAYSWLTVVDKSNNIEGFRTQFGSHSGRAELRNEFEAPVFARYPRLMEIRDELLRIGAFRAAMSGSGSVMFGQFRTEFEARRAASELDGRFAVKVARPLSRAEYFSRLMD